MTGNTRARVERPAPRPRWAVPAWVREARPTGLPIAASAFITSVFAGWLVAALYSVHHLTSHGAFALLPVIVLTTLVQRFKLVLHTGNIKISLGTVGSLAAGMLYGPAGAIMTSTFSTLAGGGSGKAHALAFNLGATSISNALGVGAYVALLRLAPGSDVVMAAPAALVAGLVTYVGQTAFLVAVIALSKGLSPRRVWDEHCSWMLPHWMGMGLLALGLASTYRATGVLGLLAFAGPALLMRYSMKQYIDHTARSAREMADRNEDLARANRLLEQETAERRHAEAVATQARDIAERTNRAKSDFLSRMSHELRTPLHVILGFAQMLEMDADTENERESVDMILKAGQHLLDLINQVLDITRVEAGALAVTFEPVLVWELVQEAMQLVQPLAARRAIDLRPGAAPPVRRYVLADRQRLMQVLLNLLSNAMKYNRDGGTVDMSCEISGAGRLRILVRDSGAGIPAASMERLFTPFDRLGAEQGEIEGTGLGLPLSKSLVETMGGEIGVESVPGQGSTFWVDLPLAVAPPEQGDTRDHQHAA